MGSVHVEYIMSFLLASMEDIINSSDSNIVMSILSPGCQLIITKDFRDFTFYHFYQFSKDLSNYRVSGVRLEGITDFCVKMVKV